MNKIITAFLMIMTLSALAQSKKTPDVFEEGYIITLKGDTVFGSIKIPKNNNELYQKVTLKEAKTNKIKPYASEKIKGYFFKNYFYQSAYFNNKPCFLKVLSAGKANLFQVEYEVMDNGKQQALEFCVTKQGKKEEEFILLEAKGLKKQLKDIFKPNKELIQKVSDTKDMPYSAETLEPLFKEYNTTAN